MEIATTEKTLVKNHAHLVKLILTDSQDTDFFVSLAGGVVRSSKNIMVTNEDELIEKYAHGLDSPNWLELFERYSDKIIADANLSVINEIDDTEESFVGLEFKDSQLHKAIEKGILFKY